MRWIAGDDTFKTFLAQLAKFLQLGIRQLEDHAALAVALRGALTRAAVAAYPLECRAVQPTGRERPRRGFHVTFLRDGFAHGFQMRGAAPVEPLPWSSTNVGGELLSCGVGAAHRFR